MRTAEAPSRRPGEAMLRQAGFGIALIALLSGGVNLLILVSPIYMFQVFDRVLLTFRVETLIYLSLVAGVCIVVLGVFDGCAAWRWRGSGAGGTTPPGPTCSTPRWRRAHPRAQCRRHLAGPAERAQASSAGRRCCRSSMPRGRRCSSS
jgi:hypothetical protein